MTYFAYLKSWFLFLLCSLFSSKNVFNFLEGGRGMFYVFDVPRGEGFNEIRWNPTEGGGGVNETKFLREHLKCMATKSK